MNVQEKILEELRALRKLQEAPPHRRELHSAAAAADHEIADTTPMEIPIQFQGGPSTSQIIQDMVRQEVSQWAREENLGTFQEEDDFEEEDPDLISMTQFELTEYQMEDDVPVEDASPPFDPDEPRDTSPDPAPAEGASPPETEASKPTE